MYSKSLICSLVLPPLLALSACKKVIQVDLNNSIPQIVIEGEITNTAGPYLVKISKSVNFSASNTFPPVSGAIVLMTDSNNGLVAHMTETSPGTYSGNVYGGVPLHTYKLSVTVEGKEYTASSTMPQPVTLDSVTFVQNFDFNNKSVINAVVNFQDPPGRVNYYQFTEEVNNVAVPDFLVFEDRLSDGRYIQQTLFNDTSRMRTDDTLSLKMYSVDKNIYQYFFTLREVTGSNSFRSSTPANPVSNISNGALGYFSAHTVTKKRLRVY
jgi:hypothetical protein